MTRTGLTVERVLELIAVYGAHSGLWPQDERAGAQALIAAQPERFAEALREAEEIDLLLEREPVPEPDPALAARILASAPRARRAGGWIAPFRTVLSKGTRLPAGAALASLAMGLIAGYAYAASSSTGFDEADVVYSSAFSVQADYSWLDEEAAS